MKQSNMSIKLFIALLVVLVGAATACTASNNSVDDSAITDAPTEAQEGPGQIDIEALEARYGERLISVEELSGWVEAEPFINHFADGSCRNFLLESNLEVRLSHCAFDSTETYNLELVRDFHAETDPLVDLKSASTYDYEADYEFYAFLDDDNSPKYLLLLEQDGFLFSASLVTLSDDPFLEASDLADGFDAETDELLHQLIARSLESSGS